MTIRCQGMNRVYNAEELMILTSSCQTDVYYLPLQESYQSIVLSLRFDWLAFFKVARFE